ncbi:hypothetical protein BD770DRAFT_449899 [Pilaira anomala]|nr:hypothetical protein BD770DRAFT_449899 [Pilaira anomala]
MILATHLAFEGEPKFSLQGVNPEHREIVQDPAPTLAPAPVPAPVPADPAPATALIHFRAPLEFESIRNKYHGKNGRLVDERLKRLFNPDHMSLDQISKSFLECETVEQVLITMSGMEKAVNYVKHGLIFLKRLFSWYKL